MCIYNRIFNICHINKYDKLVSKKRKYIMKFKAKWTGEYPSLCIGEWKLYRKYEDYLDDGTKKLDISS